MTTWEYATLRGAHGKWYVTRGVDPTVDKYDGIDINLTPYPLIELGQCGWEVYAVTERDAANQYDSNVRVTYYMKRRRDRYCEHCAQGMQQMTGLEQITP